MKYFKNFGIIGTEEDTLRYIRIYNTKNFDIDLNFYRNKTVLLTLVIENSAFRIISLGNEYLVTEERLIAIENLLGIIHAEF